MKKIAVMNSKGLIFGLIVLAFLFSLSNCKKENQLPSCTITYPSNGDEFEQGDTIAISVEANDNDGLIAEVRFYIDDIGVSSSTSFPYTYTWNASGETIGSHIIKVTAKDNDGGAQTDECTISIIGNATVVTTEADSITYNSAMSGGNITDDGGTSILERGVCWNTSQNPTLSNDHTTDGNGSGSFTSEMTDLSPNVTYYIRAYATNSVGISYGNEISFTTLKTLPTITTDSTSSVLAYSVLVFGNLVNNGGTTINAKGVCWSTNQNPSLDNNIGYTFDSRSIGYFASILNGLQSNTTYYVKAYVTNSQDTVYGMEISFITSKTDIVIDYDENVYNTIQIGNQYWMTENLKTIHYANGDIIPNVTDNTDWGNLITGARCYYNNDSTSYVGPLYNWFTVTDNRNVCPNGWHVPSFDEWYELIMYLEILQNEANDTDWNSASASGISLPSICGIRIADGRFYYYDWLLCPFWSTTEHNNNNVWSPGRYSDDLYIHVGYVSDKNYGLHVRCIKDE